MTGMPSVAGRILRLAPATRDALVRGVGSGRLEALAAAPKHAIPKAPDRTIAGGAGDPLRTRTGTAGR